MENDQQINGLNKQQEFSPREFLFKYLHFTPWIILSVAIFLILAYLQIRYTNPVYLISGKLLLKSENTQSGQDGMFTDIFMLQSGNSNQEDQIELIKSSAISKMVIAKEKLQVTYLNEGNIRTTTIYPTDCPFSLEIITIKDSSHSFTMPVKILENNSFTIDEGKSKVFFGRVFQSQFGLFRLHLTNSGSPITPGNNSYFVNWQPIESIARGLAQKVKISRGENSSNVLYLSLEHENPKLGRDILNQFMDSYREFSRDDRKKGADNTIEFIDDQLANVKKDLGYIEGNLQSFRESNKAFNIPEQTTAVYSNIGMVENQLSEQQVKVKVADFLIKYVADETNSFKLVPVSLGIDEPSLLQFIAEYNRLQLQRETSLKTMPAENRIITDMDVAISKLRSDILTSLVNVKQRYELTIDDLKKKTLSANTELKTMPGKEKKLLEIARQQKIQEELYSFLLQKKLETSIGAAAQISSSQVLESAYYLSQPISPNQKGIYTLMFFAGLAIPIGIIFLSELFNDKVKIKSDITHRTSTPIMGEIGHSDEKKTLIISKNNRHYIAEQFRILRSNLQYVLPDKDKGVLLVTSSSSGEGKSFISTNLAAVMAITGKKTVILEFDIRKPKIMVGLGISNNNKGITNFLIGNATLDEIIQPVPSHENLFVIPCGPIPPNPAELILNERLKILFEEVKKQFQFVIIDSAPVGLVSDGFTLGQYADATVYIVRHNYSLKKQVSLIDDLYKNKKLNHITIVINDIANKAGYGGYYGGYGFMGYGYGNDSGYFANAKKHKSSWKIWEKSNND